MNAVLPQSYTNELSAEHLHDLDKPVFTDEQLAGFNEAALATIRQKQDYIDAHPPVGIYRLATEGSQTREGGVIQKATSPLTSMLDNGQEVRAAQKGDYVIYPNGTTAQIVTGAGEGYSHLALVGSRLSNGDEIINTPDNGCVFIAREGVPMADDFLPLIEGES